MSSHRCCHKLAATWSTFSRSNIAILQLGLQPSWVWRQDYTVIEFKRVIVSAAINDYMWVQWYKTRHDISLFRASSSTHLSSEHCTINCHHGSWQHHTSPLCSRSTSWGQTSCYWCLFHPPWTRLVAWLSRPSQVHLPEYVGKSKTILRSTHTKTSDRKQTKRPCFLWKLQPIIAMVI